jgi:putative LysE/RhtB family amino acid efflux pump
MAFYTLCLKAVRFGFMLAAPIGPVGLLCTQNVVTFGFWEGLSTGLGASIGISLYGLIIALGLTTITTLTLTYATTIKIIGAIILIALGIKDLLSTPDVTLTTANNTFSIKTIGTTLLLTLTSPMTIVTFISLLPTLGCTAGSSSIESLSMLASIFVGSMAWWIILSFVINYAKRYVSNAILSKISTVSGIALIVFAFYLMLC